MTAPPILVLRSAGTNCDRELVHALELAGGRPDLHHVGEVYRGDVDLRGYRMVTIPGGFTYGDDLGAGTILATEIQHYLRESLAELVRRGGFVLGICNGFQALVKSGLLPGSPSLPRVSLVRNDSDRFECRWVTLRAPRSNCSWMEEGFTFPVPVAHAEGKLVLPSNPGALETLRQGGHVALRYVHESGETEAGYPANPNGSVDDIAGLTDETGRIFGLMPHPERNILPWHLPTWTRSPEREEGEGLAWFRSLVTAAGA